ncbi:hypothetical protein ES706_03710 [subsurface metagenome]|nr:hypothetical protein [Bacillota bacterium]
MSEKSKKNIVGISFKEEKPSGISRLSSNDKHCYFIGKARKGKAFYISAENISCPLARFYLGIELKDLKDLSHTLVSWNDAIDEKVGLNYLNSARCIKKSKRYIVYFAYPYQELKPDIIIKIDSPDQVMFTIQKFSSFTGARVNASLSGIGAACGECTAYPLVTREANVSVGCYGSRPGVNLEKEELFLAAPFNSKMAEVMIGRG